MSGLRVCVENGGEKILLFENLPTDVLLSVFWYCDNETLGRLCRQCKRFYDIINDDFLWVERSRKSIVTNQISKDIQARSFHILPFREKCRISSNWKQGRYKEKVYFSHKTRYMPWLSLSKDILWLSKGSCIQGFRRKRDGLHAHTPLLTLRGHSDDVCRFISVGGIIVSGGRDGAICGWSSVTGQFLFCRRDSHASDINAVSMSGSIIVSGSRDKTVKVWRHVWTEHRCELLMVLDVMDRVWSVVASPQGDVCAVGSAGYHQVPPLHIYDLQQGQKLMSFDGSYKTGAGVLDMHWETPQTLLSTGYDTYIRLWDIRMGRCVNSWEDPYDSAIYCLSSDNINTILCGAAHNARVQLWDKRHSRSVQMYFMSTNHSSPVYSLAFDPCQLFVALDQSLNIMDFSGFRNRAISYM